MIKIDQIQDLRDLKDGQPQLKLIHAIDELVLRDREVLVNVKALEDALQAHVVVEERGGELLQNQVDAALGNVARLILSSAAFLPMLLLVVLYLAHEQLNVAAARLPRVRQTD